MAANDNHAHAPMPALELLLRASVLQGKLDALADAADPRSAAVLHYAVRILRLLEPDHRGAVPRESGAVIGPSGG
jgi:hypothetical protein